MMKKSLIAVAVLGIALLSFSIASPALAADLERGGSGNSRGTHGGAGNASAMGTGLGIPVEQEINLDGALEDLMHEYIAAGFGITLEDLTTRLDAGETMSEIGLSLDFDLETIREILSQARADALAEAVTAGILTQEQADWLASRGSRNPANGFDDGLCDGDCDPDGSLRSSFSKSQRKGFGK